MIEFFKVRIYLYEVSTMIEIFVGLIVMFLFSGKEETTDSEEYYPYMYDHFNSDNDWDWDD